MNETSVDVLIVGAGFSGLGMAIRLLQSGWRSFLIVDKHEDVGGTWWANTYPGCACDIPSHLYSFSFELNPEWSRMFPAQGEIEAYLRRCAERYGVMPYVRLRAPLTEARWNGAEKVWEALAGKGQKIRARVLVSAIGALHIPHYPQLEGLEHFEGPVFHSAAWNHAVDLRGRRIGVIGTGASAIQFVPQIAPLAGKLTLFQRTAAWIVPRPDFAISPAMKRLFRRVPGAMRLFRLLIYLRQESLVAGFLGDERVREKLGGIARRHLNKQVRDAELRAKLTPHYEVGCKRVLVSSDFYPAVQRENVELVTERIREVCAHSVVTEDGVERPQDVLIFGTGFHATEPLRGLQIVGRGGLALADAWKERMSAYLGITVAGFPNLFLLLGPNTGLGHNSVVLMIEAQIRYVMDCLKLMRRRGAEVMEVREEGQARFTAEMRERLTTTVWQTGGCSSWYQDARTGENPTIWPGSVASYRARTKRADAAQYLFGS